jgi:protease-4
LSLPWARPVGLIVLRGAIGVGVRAEQWVPVLDGLRKRKAVRTLVIEIDSPGGTVTGSDSLYAAVRRLAEVKPVIAFSGNVCASGGYYIASAARKFVVQPAAVIGSIGVISYRPLAEDLMRRLGVAMNVTKSGEFKDMGGFWRQPTQREQEKEAAMVKEYFELFLERILAGRPIDEAKLRELATGEVFTGRRAVELGLADQLGTFEEAVALAAQEAGVSERARWFGPRRSLRSRLFGGFAGELADHVLDRVFALAGPEPWAR